MHGFADAYVIGNLTRDPEIRYTPQGKASALFSIAVNRTRTKKATGERVEETTYIDIRAWEKIAEICKEAKKGDAMFVHGEIREERWEKDGQKRSKLRLVAQDVRRLPRFTKPYSAPTAAAAAPPAKPTPAAPKPAEAEEDFTVSADDDIPF